MQLATLRWQGGDGSSFTGNLWKNSCYDSRTFSVSIGAAGQMTTAYAITYALMAPLDIQLVQEPKARKRDRDV
jgi:hypothetical protein